MKKINEKMSKLGLLAVFGLVVLTGCTDTTAPEIEMQEEATIDYNNDYSDQEILDVLVSKVSDDQSSDENIALKITNFSDLNQHTEGKYTLEVSAIDEAGNETLKKGSIEVKKSDEQLIGEKQAEYLEQLTAVESLLSESKMTKYETEINKLDVDDYLDYQDTLDEYIDDVLSSTYKSNKSDLKDIEDDLDYLKEIEYDELDTYTKQYEAINNKEDDQEALIKANKEIDSLLSDLDELVASEKERISQEEKEAKEAEKEAKEAEKEAEEAEKEAEEAEKEKEAEEQASIVGSSLSSNSEVSADACSTSGYREPNAKVDIGYDSDYANREYWAYTNEYSQLVSVTAAQIILQDDDVEPVKSSDRYCNDEAKVSGVESADLDEGHVIADSLGGVSNAYNITPQESSLNRYGIQADIEESIRSAGGASDFVAEIAYPNTTTQIPSSYTISYVTNGTAHAQTFVNEYDTAAESTTSTEAVEPVVETVEPVAEVVEPEVETADTSVYYENCTDVRDHGANPIYEGEAGWQDKFDRDGDGVACE